MFDLFSSDDGSEVESEEDEGCNHHHFEDYESRDTLRAEMQTQTRHFDERIRDVGEWCTTDWRSSRGFSWSDVDVRHLAVVERKHVATCEHEGCRATDVEYREEDSYVHETTINSTPEEREGDSG